MTGEQSRQLKVGDWVCWDQNIADRGRVVGVDWSGVTMRWDDGQTTLIQHNDMARIDRAPANLA
jgi:hypothetical protein